MKSHLRFTGFGSVIIAIFVTFLFAGCGPSGTPATINADGGGSVLGAVFGDTVTLPPGTRLVYFSHEGESINLGPEQGLRKKLQSMNLKEGDLLKDSSVGFSYNPGSSFIAAKIYFRNALTEELSYSTDLKNVHVKVNDSHGQALLYYGKQPTG